jgi:SRSO17 transposase
MKHHKDTTGDTIRPSKQEIGGWTLKLQQLHERIAPHFARPEPRKRALLYLQAILSEVARKNCWHIAEQANQEQPYGMQRLLSSAVWDCDGVRDVLRSHVLEQLGTQGAIAVLDESSFPKRGNKSAGVKKQYCGNTGRVENCQVGVFLSHVTERGHALIDRDLYLPLDWIHDRERCKEAGIPETVEFRPKWEQALHLLKRAGEAGVSFRWTVADTVYGQARDLRTWLEERDMPYVLGIPSDEPVCVHTQGRSQLAEARQIQATLKPEDWHRLPMSQGTKGPRLFDWALLPVIHKGIVDGRHWLLIRRCIDDPHALSYYLVFAPPATPLREMVEAIGARWHIEEDLQVTKALGLDQYEVRSFIGWYRHITLVMLAYAFLVGIRVQDTSHLEALEEPSPAPAAPHPILSQVGLAANGQLAKPSPPLLPITTKEIRHLLARLFFVLPNSPTRALAWSAWRRQHQACASLCHTNARLKAG